MNTGLNKTKRFRVNGTILNLGRIEGHPSEYMIAPDCQISAPTELPIVDSFRHDAGILGCGRIIRSGCELIVSGLVTPSPAIRAVISQYPEELWGSVSLKVLQSEERGPIQVMTHVKVESLTIIRSLENPLSDPSIKPLVFTPL